MKATFSHELLLVGLVLWGTAAEGTHARRDIFGNAVGNTPDIGSIVWAPIACTAFGLRTDQILPSLLPGMPLYETLNYRGKRLDPTGDYWWGARNYDPVQGQSRSRNHSRRHACPPMNGPECSFSVFTVPTVRERLSLTIRTLQPTGHPRPVLSPSKDPGLSPPTSGARTVVGNGPLRSG